MSGGGREGVNSVAKMLHTLHICCCCTSTVSWSAAFQCTFCVHSPSHSLSLCQADRSSVPQPIELRVRCLRAARDKLPRGLYAVSVALHQRLGGAAIAWCGERSTHHQCAVSTEPVEHQGRHYDSDLHVNQNLFMVSVFFSFLFCRSLTKAT